MATKKKEDPIPLTEPPTIDVLIRQINKEFGDGTAGRIEDFKEMKVERIKTNIPQLDEAVGGGFPLGTMVELYGTPSSGKSLIAQKLIADVQKKGKAAVYIDCESTFDPVFARQLGVDPNKVVLIQTSMGEDTFAIMRKLLEAEPGIIVFDSIGAMVTKVEGEKEFQDTIIAPKARLLSRALPVINQVNKNTLILFINQLRTNITAQGSFGSFTPGGKSLGYYSSIRVELKVDSDYIHPEGKKTGDIIGQVVQFNVKKNKTAIPFKTGSFKFIYEGAKFE